MRRTSYYLGVVLLSMRCASAGDLATPSAFETHFVPAMRGALEVDPFFGSKLVQSFDLHMNTVASMPSPQHAALYLQIAVKGVRLDERALTDKQAGAVLAAASLAAPKQFNAAISRLEEIKPGLGGRILESYHGASETGSNRTATALVKAGEVLRLNPTALTYNAKGEIEHLFDGGAQP